MAAVLALGLDLDRIRAAGYEVESSVLIGAGVRADDQVRLFEKLLNLVHERAPKAKLCFNSTPADSLEAVQRWV